MCGKLCSGVAAERVRARKGLVGFGGIEAQLCGEGRPQLLLPGHKVLLLLAVVVAFAATEHALSAKALDVLVNRAPHELVVLVGLVSQAKDGVADTGKGPVGRLLREPLEEIDCRVRGLALAVCRKDKDHDALVVRELPEALAIDLLDVADERSKRPSARGLRKTVRELLRSAGLGPVHNEQILAVVHNGVDKRPAARRRARAGRPLNSLKVGHSDGADGSRVAEKEPPNQERKNSSHNKRPHHSGIVRSRRSHVVGPGDRRKRDRSAERSARNQTHSHP
eukprot:Amastigsp_a175322_89.p2 type:complete len:280 gc:universal Amastigsp_a175322_89:879-40(-)